ncbi:MAG: D-glycero-beta-D-manno-heptose 1,7-bisphosphate 7-phosphatase [bacterium]
MAKSKSVVFLDRDGTINEEVNYLSTIEQFKFIDGAVDAIRLLNEAGLLAILITNQAGVARGYYDEDRVAKIHDFMEKQLQRSGARLDGIYYCPHHPTAGLGKYKIDCQCRKPNPGLLEKAAADLHIDLSKSYVIGDKISDLQAGLAVGCRTILVRTGYGKEVEKALPEDGLQPDYIADDVLEAVGWILGSLK